MYKAELELEKRLNDIALANVPSTSYENIVVVPKKIHEAPLNMSPADFDLRDLAIEQKMNVISLNAIVDKLGWKPSKIMSDVTKEMIADYQLEMTRNMKDGLYIPASIDNDPLEDPQAPDVLTTQEEEDTRTQLKAEVTRLGEIQAALAEIPNDIRRAEQTLEQQLATKLLRADRLYRSDMLQRARAKALYRREFDTAWLEFHDVALPAHVNQLEIEQSDVTARVEALTRSITDSIKNASEYQREVSQVRDENARRNKIYEDTVRTLNQGANFITMLPDETIDEYKQRLRDIGASTANGSAVEAAASLLYTDRLREKMAEITRDDVLVGDFIRRLSTDERYSLVKMFDSFKKKVLEIFGQNNRLMSADDLVNISEGISDSVLVEAIKEPGQFKKATDRSPKVFTVEEGIESRYALSPDGSTLSQARQQALLAFANEGRKLPRMTQLNPRSEAIYRAELGLIEEFIQRRDGSGKAKASRGAQEDLEGRLEWSGISGKGLHSSYPQILPFGLIELSPHKLFYENVLKITRKGKHLTGFPNVKVSNEFVSFIFKILDGHQPALRDVNQLSVGEKQLFDSLIFTAGLQKKVDSIGSGVKQTLKERLALIEGEISSGNTNDMLIKEARKILQHLARMKIIGHRTAAAHLKQLINAQRG